MRYTILESYEVSELIHDVNNLLAANWCLQGGIAVELTKLGSTIYFQALYHPNLHPLDPQSTTTPTNIPSTPNPNP